MTVMFNQGPELGEGGSTPGREGTGGEKGSVTMDGLKKG